MSNYKCVKISDPRISNCTDAPELAVKAGAAEITANQFKANSSSNSNFNFNINVPSPNIIIDRDIYIEADVQFVITIGPRGAAGAADAAATGAHIEPGDLALEYGFTDSLGAFPLNSLFSTASCTINNVNTSVQTSSILQALLRSSTAKNLAIHNGATPALSDRFYLNYEDAVSAATGNVMADITGMAGFDGLLPRGAHYIEFVSIIHQTFDYTDLANIVAVPNDTSLYSRGLQDSWVLTLTTKLSEPLIGLSPWLYGDDTVHNSMGLYGVNNINFNMTIDGTMNKFWSTTAYPKPLGWSIALLPAGGATSAFSNVIMRMKFLSPNPSDAAKLPMKNIVPITNYTQYISNNNSLMVYTATPLATQKYPETVLQTIAISLSLVPDLIYILVRKPMSQQNPFSTASFLTINSVVCTFNNKAGILSNYNSLDLYNLSKKNGLCDSSYLEWSGTANLALAPPVAAASPAQCNNSSYLNTAGSILILSPTDFGLPDFIAPGSQGQYTLQFQITCTSNYQYDITPEVVVLIAESGMLITESGQSSIELALLTPDMVLEAKTSSDHIPADKLVQEVGGSIHNRHRGSMKTMKKEQHHNHINHHEHGGALTGGHLTGGNHIKGQRLSKYY